MCNCMYIVFEKHNLTSLEELHHLQKILTSLIQAIMRFLDNLCDDVELPSNNKLPLTTMSQIEEVEKALQDERKKIPVGIL